MRRSCDVGLRQPVWGSRFAVPAAGRSCGVLDPQDDRRRKRRYAALMVPCVALVLFGFFVPAPTPVRLGALAVAAVLPPLAAIVGNS